MVFPRGRDHDPRLRLRSARHVRLRGRRGLYQPERPHRPTHDPDGDRRRAPRLAAGGRRPRSVRPRRALDRRLRLPDVCQHLSRRGGWHGADRRLFRVSRAHLRAGAVAEARGSSTPQATTVVPIPGYGDAETIPYASGDAHMRQLTATSPLRPMPLAVLAHGRPFALPKDPALSQGFTSKEIEPLLLAANQAQAGAGARRALLPRERERARHPPGSAGADRRSDPTSGCRRPEPRHLVSAHACCKR